MKKISRTNRFKKDVKKMKKRGKTLDIFKQVIQQLAQGEPLDENFRQIKLTQPHPLKAFHSAYSMSQAAGVL